MKYNKKTSLSEEICGRIMEQIDKQELKVGERLPSENHLCEMFGVSRTSIRAALQNLQGSGIIVTIQGVGSFVHRVPPKPSESYALDSSDQSDITSEKFKEFFEFRQAIEFKAIEFFVRRATRDDEATLSNILKQMQTVARNDDKKQFTKLDFEFHMCVIEGARNTFLYESMMMHRNVFYHYMEEIIRLSDKPLAVLANEHEELLECLLDKRAKAAKDLLLADNTYYHISFFDK
ncbi:MAG: FCD domain-containing protein [Bacillota bacterium]